MHDHQHEGEAQAQGTSSCKQVASTYEFEIPAAELSVLKEELVDMKTKETLIATTTTAVCTSTTTACWVRLQEELKLSEIREEDYKWFRPLSNAQNAYALKAMGLTGESYLSLDQAATIEKIDDLLIVQEN